MTKISQWPTVDTEQEYFCNRIKSRSFLTAYPRYAGHHSDTFYPSFRLQCRSHCQTWLYRSSRTASGSFVKLNSSEIRTGACRPIDQIFYIVLGSKKVETFPWPNELTSYFGIVRREKTVVLFYLGSYDGPFSASIRSKRTEPCKESPTRVNESEKENVERHCGDGH